VSRVSDIAIVNELIISVCVCWLYRILFGFMVVTCFLSMWLSNTACAAMMIPIACAVLKELDDHRKNMREQHRGLCCIAIFIG